LYIFIKVPVDFQGLLVYPSGGFWFVTCHKIVDDNFLRDPVLFYDCCFTKSCISGQFILAFYSPPLLWNHLEEVVLCKMWSN